jgi:hypothetical protein
MAPQASRNKRTSKNERSKKVAFFSGYFETLEKTGTVLILQAKRLVVLPTEAVCSVAGGAAGMSVYFGYVYQFVSGNVPSVGAGVGLTVFGLCAGLLAGRAIPGRDARVALESLRRLEQEQKEVWEQSDKVSEQLTALPARKDNATQRLQLERRLDRLEERDRALNTEITMMSGAIHGFSVTRTQRHEVPRRQLELRHLAVEGEPPPPPPPP